MSMLSLARTGALALALSIAPVTALHADPAVKAQAWEAVITGQIDALRTGDASAALKLSTRSFQVSYSDEPQLFIDAIVSAGYAPILESRSHAFGEFALIQPHEAVQFVRVVGRDCLVYEVVYDLVEEADGWRVRNVVLVGQNGVLA